MFYSNARGVYKQIYNLQKCICKSQNYCTQIKKTPRTFRNWYRNFWAPKSPPLPPYNHVVQIGDPVLRNVAPSVPVELIKSNEIQYVIKLMQKVMNKYDSMGIAAPQIGVSLRIFTIEMNAKTIKNTPDEVCKTKDMEVVPFTVLINPEMKIINYEKIILSEACESVRGYCADVPRFKEVSVSAYNANGERITMQAKGWTARLIQHEMDHLNGKFYTDIMDRNSLACGCWQAVNKHAGRIEIRFIP